MTPERYRRAAGHELVDGGGGTRPPPAAQEWLSPVGLRATDDGIEWLPQESINRGGVVVPSDGLLDDFVALRDADVATVLRFAEVHGVLGLAAGRWYGLGKYAHEPLTAWHEAAATAYALVDAAARLRRGRTLTDEQRLPVLRAAWPDAEPALLTPRTLFLDGEPVFEPYDNREAALRDALLMHSNGTLDDDRTQLGWAVSTWMEEAGAKLALAWPSGASEPVLTIGGERALGCLPAVTVQVALACARSESTRPCDGCGRLHAPRRQPKPGDRSFCQRCRDAGVPLKIAKRDSRARKRAEKEAQDG